jgi:cellulose 1,4-beta-cellobiosidase
VNVVAEPTDIPPVANITFKQLPGISPTTVLACAATSMDADGFVNSYQLQFSNGARFTTPSAVETFSAPGAYTATATVTDEFGATSTTSATVSADSATAPAPIPPTTAQQPQPQNEQKPIEPMRPPL